MRSASRLASPRAANGLWSGSGESSRLYDAIMRAPIVAWALLIVLASTHSLQEFLRVVDPTVPMTVLVLNIAMRVSTIAFCVLITALTVLRWRPAARAHGIEPRASALLGTFLASAIVFFPRRELSVTVEILSVLLIVAGNSAAVIALVQLGRSFSIMAEARQLVTNGLYGMVRHPLYLAEELAIIGVVIQFLSVWTALIVLTQIAFQLRRIRNEEGVLSGNFPEYESYCNQTARLLPGVY
jgi:protein-S-isoprenylcysteine O-methyltransferase Ste14